MLPDGSSFQTRDVGLAVSTRDPWFRPVDIKLGPDGALYIADWYDRQVNHYRNHEGQIDAGNGRIYRLRARESAGSVSEAIRSVASEHARAGQASSPIPTSGRGRRRCG